MTAFEDTTPFVLALLLTFTVLVCIAMWNNFNTVAPKHSYQKPENTGPSRTRELLQRFTQFYNGLEGDIHYIYDTNILPDPKQHILHALYVGYDESENDEDKLAIKSGLETLVQFQDLVGDDPLVPFFLENDDELLNETSRKENIETNPENLSDEQKKYLEYRKKRDFELELHFAHLKINNENPEEEDIKVS